METKETKKNIDFACTYRLMHKENLLLPGMDYLDSMDPSMVHCGFLERMLDTEWDMASALMEILLDEALGKVLDTEYLELVQELEQKIQ